ncbi:terminase large subunit domain-containing protein [Thalassolituus oleivorans]|uniref:terminase large subunit domain-containing protein n=1 Tax=Thalassolituus oleivorans TaxID=187493 RepID=UPI0023EF959E|nr:terminase family protein [Thalassolituus oleivorans]
MNNAIDITDTNEIDNRRQAKYLYWTGLRIARIAEMLGEKEATVHSWKARDKWDDATAIERVEGATEARYILLVMKENKEGKDFKEIDLLSRQMERFARITKYSNGGNETDLNPKIAARNAGPKKKPVRNDYSQEQADRLQEAFLDGMFEYQKDWYRAGQLNDIRNILKSRQIGATYYFSHEAAVDAVINGNNQIFISASKAQAHNFKKYIVKFCRDAADIELTGDPIILPNGAEMHFLGTNAKTAQGYTGNLYFDEYMWTHNFLEMQRVTSGMALHAKWKETYFSTPSSISHEGYLFWSGATYNEGRPKSEVVDIDIRKEILRKGQLGKDYQWRQVVTIHDALDGGCTLFNMEKLRRKYNKHQFSNLLECEFIDDLSSLFPMTMMMRCMVDSWDVWDAFFKPFANRPVGNRSVWVGYDPNGEGEDGDNAGLVVVLPARSILDKHRIIEKAQFQGLDYEEQAKAIKDLTNRYNVEHIGIDTNGIGSSVFQLVRKFFPAVKDYYYTPELKGQLVNKTYNIISKNRLEFDAGWTDIAAAFGAIRKTMTASGKKVTYSSGRNGKIGHADLAWATMHALDKDPLDGDTGNTGSIMELS